jgi:hypothetical protein
MYEQMTLLDIPSSTFSPALADGPWLPALPDGPTTAKSSPARARASRSPSRAKARELLMHGTYGPTFSESSVPAGPLASWESRLRQRLARIGSSECELTWKALATTSGPSLSRLVPSTPRIVEIDSGLLLDSGHWSTPTARDHFPPHTIEYIAAKKALGHGLSNLSDIEPLGMVPSGSSPTTEKRGVLNPAFPCWLMGYPIVWVFCGASAMQSFRKSPQK